MMDEWLADYWHIILKYNCLVEKNPKKQMTEIYSYQGGE